MKEEEQQKPIESCTLINKSGYGYDYVIDVKLRPHIEKKIKEMFSGSLEYLESVDICKEYRSLLQDMLKLDITDCNHCFMVSTAFDQLHISLPRKLTNSISICFYKYYEYCGPIEIDFWVDISYIFRVVFKSGRIDFEIKI